MQILSTYLASFSSSNFDFTSNSSEWELSKAKWFQKVIRNIPINIMIISKNAMPRSKNINLLSMRLLLVPFLLISWQHQAEFLEVVYVEKAKWLLIVNTVVYDAFLLTTLVEKLSTKMPARVKGYWKCAPFSFSKNLLQLFLFFLYSYL